MISGSKKLEFERKQNKSELTTDLSIERTDKDFVCSVYVGDMFGFSRLMCTCRI